MFAITIEDVIGIWFSVIAAVLAGYAVWLLWQAYRED